MYSSVKSATVLAADVVAIATPAGVYGESRHRIIQEMLTVRSKDNHIQPSHKLQAR